MRDLNYDVLEPTRSIAEGASSRACFARFHEKVRPIGIDLSVKPHAGEHRGALKRLRTSELPESRSYPSREFRLLVQSQLGINAGDMYANGMEADAQAAGDCFSSMSGGEKKGNLEFARGQQLDRIGGDLGGWICGKLAQNIIRAARDGQGARKLCLCRRLVIGCDHHTSNTVDTKPSKRSFAPLR
jgi:hypothetical protein